MWPLRPARPDFLCQRYSLSPPTEGSIHFTCDFGTFRLKWERHGEFCTYTFFCQNPSEQPFALPAILTVPRDWLEALPGERLVAVHIAVDPRNRPPPSAVDLATIFDPRQFPAVVFSEERP